MLRKPFVIISKNNGTFGVPFPKTRHLLVLCPVFRAGGKLNSSHHSRRQTEMDQQKIGEFLKTLRKDKNLTQEELADKMNVSRRTVSRWETGSNLPDLSILVELADLYDVDMREIFNGERKNETMDKDLKETMLMAADYTDDNMKKVMKRMQLMFIGATVCGALYILLIFFGPDIDTGLYGFLNGGLLGIMFGMLIMGIFITDKNFRKVTEWKQSMLGKNKK